MAACRNVLVLPRYSRALSALIRLSFFSHVTSNVRDLLIADGELPGNQNADRHVAGRRTDPVSTLFLRRGRA